MLEEVLRHINNWFLVPNGIHENVYTIENGGITLPFLVDKQYFRIIGSVFNDGLYKYGDELTLVDETFDGAVWALSVPNSIITVSEEIIAWKTKNGVSGPYVSESFGGYSYTKATNNNGNAIGWQDAFKSQLDAYRKVGNCDAVQPTKINTPIYKRPFDPDYPWR